MIEEFMTEAEAKVIEDRINAIEAMLLDAHEYGDFSDEYVEELRAEREHLCELYATQWLGG